MAITATERTQIIELVVMMFEAVPGATYLPQVVAMYEANGHNLLTLATQLDDTTVHQGLNPPTQTLCAFTSELLGALHLAQDPLATDFVASRWVAGESKGQIAYEAMQALENVGSSASAQYQWARATLHNKELAAEYLSVTMMNGSTDIDALRSLLAPVDADHPFSPIVVVSIVGTSPTELPTGL